MAKPRIQISLAVSEERHRRWRKAAESMRPRVSLSELIRWALDEFEREKPELFDNDSAR